jgi:hypothetical protein
MKYEDVTIMLHRINKPFLLKNHKKVIRVKKRANAMVKQVITARCKDGQG